MWTSSVLTPPWYVVCAVCPAIKHVTHPTYYYPSAINIRFLESFSTNILMRILAKNSRLKECKRHAHPTFKVFGPTLSTSVIPENSTEKALPLEEDACCAFSGRAETKPTNKLCGKGMARGYVPDRLAVVQVPPWCSASIVVAVK
jgi:hypothetical protein